MIALGLLTSFVVMLLTSTTGEDLQYSDLLRLVKNEDGKGYIEVDRKIGDKKSKGRILEAHRNQDRQLRGHRQDRRKTPADEKEPAEVSFTTNIKPIDNRLPIGARGKGHPLRQFRWPQRLDGLHADAAADRRLRVLSSSS